MLLFGWGEGLKYAFPWFSWPLSDEIFPAFLLALLLLLLLLFLLLDEWPTMHCSKSATFRLFTDESVLEGLKTLLKMPGDFLAILIISRKSIVNISILSNLGI
jgi:hypothetical protein